MVDDAKGLRALVGSLAIVTAIGLTMIQSLHADDRPAVRVLAAGSLRVAIGEIAAAFSGATGVSVESGFGPSGVLRERIEKGKAPTSLPPPIWGILLPCRRPARRGPSCSSRAIGFAHSCGRG